MLLIRLPEIKSFALQRKTKRIPTDTLMAEVTVPVEINQQFEFQTYPSTLPEGESPFEQFTCQEVTKIYHDGAFFYAIKAQGAF